MSLFNELKRRNVFKVGVAYLITAWLLIQVADILLDNIGAPSWVLQAIFVVLGVGLFISLLVAWAFELTPEGLKKEKDVDRNQSITPHTGRKLNMIIITLLVMGMAYFFWESRFSGSDSGVDQSRASNDGISQPLAEEAGAEPEPEPEPVISRQSIAVLPFENRSRNVEDEYFTEGIHDDLLTNLARIGALKVISRTSVSRYKETEKSIPEIAAELGVATVMEGAVQRSGSTVRINVQLIDAKTDEHLWAEIFDRELTAENLFAIQSEISKKIADALEATLSVQEEQSINDFPTQSLEAYNAYLRGLQLVPQRNSTDLGLAMESFQHAVELDPGFALAWVGIADSAGLLSAHGTLNPDERNKIAAASLNRALEINPLLGEAYASKGSLYYDLNQKEEGELAFKRAIELSPNYAPAYKWYANRLQDTNNRLQEALELLNQAEQLDPLSPIIQSNKASLYVTMGRYAEAETEYRQLLTANPEFSQGMTSMSWELYTIGLGQLDSALSLARESYRVDPGKIYSLNIEWWVLLSLEDDDKASSIYQQMEDLDADHFTLPLSKAWMEIKHGRFAAAKEQAMYLTQHFHGADEQWQAAVIFARSGDFKQAREYMLKIEPGYLDRMQWPELLNAGTADACTVGLVLMRTGDEALGRDLLSFTANYWQETAPLYIRHADRLPSYECYGYLGEVEKSLAALETSLNHKHALINWVYVASDPEMRLVHEDPGFKALDQQARAELARQRENLAPL